jgi:thermitase
MLRVENGGDFIMKNLKRLTCILLLLAFAVASMPLGVMSVSAAAESEYTPGRVIIGVDTPSNGVIAAIRSRGGTIIQQIPHINALVVQVKVGTEEKFVQSAKLIPGVKYAERDGVARALYTPNDPQWGSQWNMRIISADKAWDIHKGSLTVTVAIVDTGVDYNHQDIAAHYVAGGRDWVNNDANPMDDNRHGTHCAGIAAAVMDNGLGVAGVAQVGIWAEKVLNRLGSGSLSNVANGIIHATDGGVKVISMSLGGGGSRALSDACAYAWNHGVLLVAAAGNNNRNIDKRPSYPASYSTVVAVAATDSNDNKASYSNYGFKIEVAAPGSNILSTLPGNTYGSLSGTSMACPHVAGLAGLVWSYNLWMTNQDVRNRLHQGVDDLGTPLRDQKFGYGRINAYKALAPTALVNQHTYSFSIAPSGSWSQTSSLNDDYYGSTTGTGYVDQFTMTVTTATHGHLEIAALASGNTIAAIRPSDSRCMYATAPNEIVVDMNFAVGTYVFLVGYVKPNNGAFPATYTITVTGS